MLLNKHVIWFLKLNIRNQYGPKPAFTFGLITMLVIPWKLFFSGRFWEPLINPRLLSRRSISWPKRRAIPTFNGAKKFFQLNTLFVSEEVLWGWKAMERCLELLTFRVLQPAACEEVKAWSFFLFHEECADKTLHNQTNLGQNGIFRVELVDLTCVCKPLVVQLLFLRFGEIHQSTKAGPAVRWAEQCPAVISGMALLRRQDSEWSSLCFVVPFVHASALYCYFYLHRFHLKTDSLLVGVS